MRLEVRRLELNPETSATRREIRRKTARVGFKFSVVILFAMGLFSAGKIVVMEAFVDNTRFQLQHFSVITEGELTPSQIIASSGLREGVNLLGISLVQVREKLEMLPQVREAKISRGYPGLLFLEIKQRHPVAWLDVLKSDIETNDAGKSYLLDEEGYVLPAAKMSNAQDRLPVIVVNQSCRMVLGCRIESTQVLNALELLKANATRESGQLSSIKRVELTKSDVLTAHYVSNMRVLFSVIDIDKQLIRLERIMNEAVRQKWQIATVDLLVQQNVPITLQETQSVNDESQITTVIDKRPSASSRSLAKAR